MKEERNIITMDEQGNIFLPSDIGAIAMTEWEICELFGVIAPTVRAGIKALCKSGVLSIYDIKRIIRLSDKYSAEVLNLTIQPSKLGCQLSLHSLRSLEKYKFPFGREPPEEAILFRVSKTS